MFPTKSAPLATSERSVEICTKCYGTGAFCLGLLNGKPYSNTGFTCYRCSGSGYIVKTIVPTCAICGGPLLSDMAVALGVCSDKCYSADMGQDDIDQSQCAGTEPRCKDCGVSLIGDMQIERSLCFDCEFPVIAGICELCGGVVDTSPCVCYR